MKRPSGTKALSFILAILLVSTLIIVLGPVTAGACGFQNWYLPEGYTGGNFDTYILVQNPQSSEAEASLRFLTEESVTDPLKLELEPCSRTTVMIDEQPGLEDASVSTMVQADRGVVVERAMYFTYEGDRAGGSNSIGANQTSNYWYLAEGYTGGGFDTYVLVMNPNRVPVDVTAEFITPKGDGTGRTADPHEPDPDPAPESDYISRSYTIEPMRRLTIHVDEIPGLEDAEVSTVVRSVSSGSGGEEEARGVVAERAVYFDYFGIDGGHCSIGAPGTSNTWYLPEGRTAGEFDTYVLVMNPNACRTGVRATFMVESEGAGRTADPHDPEPDPAPEPEPDPDPLPDELVTREYVLEPYERFTIAVDDIPGLPEGDVATMVESCAPSADGESGSGRHPVVVERAVYFTRGDDGDGHNTVGATTKHEYWLLAEGYTAGSFDTWVLIQNPNSYEVLVEATFMTPEGDPIEKEYVVAAGSRRTILVDDIPGLQSTEVSTKLQVLRPEEYEADCSYGIIAERAMYFEYNGVMGGHCSLGVGE